MADYDDDNTDLGILFLSDEYDSSAGGDVYRVRGIFGSESDVNVIHKSTGTELCKRVLH